MKVLLTHPFLPADINYIKERIVKGIEIIIPHDFDEMTLISYAYDVDVLFGGFISRPLLESAQKLSFIQIPWTGIEKVNIELLIEKKIILCNSHSNSLVVAEHAIALMMDAAKRLSYHDRLLRKGYWNRPGINNEFNVSPFSSQIYNSNVCIIGFGAIGSKIARLLSGFNCKIHVVSKEWNSKDIFDSITYYYPHCLEKVLPYQKFVFISVPLTKETINMVDDNFFNLMSPDSILINISRGEIIDERALFYALSSKKIAFAALDTWYNYPSKNEPFVFPSKKFPFHTLDNIVLSPHRAGFSEDGFPHLDDAIDNLNAFFKGEKLKNIVDFNKRY